MKKSIPLFSDELVSIPLLKQRAFNLRWAEQPSDVIPLTAADPDFPICESIQEGLIRYIQDGLFNYAPAEGLPQFREKVADWFMQTRQFACSASAVFAVDSAASGMAVVAKALLEAGDEVFIPDPVDFLFQHTITQVGASPVRLAITPHTTAEDFIEQMAEKITPHTKMLWLCNPHNPLGIVYSKAWLEKVAHWAIEKGLKILSDEIWSDIVYKPNKHTCLASISPEIAKHVVTIYGFSKNFGLAGLRIGCVICTNPSLYASIVAHSDAKSTVYGTSVLSQIAVISALTHAHGWLNKFVDHLHIQRDFVINSIAQWPDVTCFVPEGTYVVFPNVSHLTSDVEAFCEYLRQHANVALVPGASQWFGPNAKGHIRLCFATSQQILKQAFQRLTPLICQARIGLTEDRYNNNQEMTHAVL